MNFEMQTVKITAKLPVIKGHISVDLTSNELSAAESSVL